MKFAEEDYLNFSPYEGEDGEVSCRTVKLVKANKEHDCFFGLGSYGDGHKISKGDVYRYEKELIDGDFFGSYKVCVKCMDEYLTDLRD